HIFETENRGVEFNEWFRVGNREAHIENATVERSKLHELAVISVATEPAYHHAAQGFRAFGEQIADRTDEVLRVLSPHEFDCTAIDVGNRNAGCGDVDQFGVIV